MLTRSAKLKLGFTYWTSAATLFGIVTWCTLTVVDMKHDLGQAEKDRSALSQQVKDLGGTPVVGPRGNSGVPGRDGRTGNTGAQGARGTDGTNGTSGKAGSNGSNGVDGVDGTDGTDGAAGPTGTTGPAGPAGAVGPQGESGPECPTGYSPTEVTINMKNAIACVSTEG